MGRSRSSGEVDACGFRRGKKLGRRVPILEPPDLQVRPSAAVRGCLVAHGVYKLGHVLCGPEIDADAVVLQATFGAPPWLTPVFVLMAENINVVEMGHLRIIPGCGGGAQGIHHRYAGGSSCRDLRPPAKVPASVGA